MRFMMKPKFGATRKGVVSVISNSAQYF